MAKTRITKINGDYKMIFPILNTLGGNQFTLIPGWVYFPETKNSKIPNSF